MESPTIVIVGSKYNPSFFYPQNLWYLQETKEWVDLSSKAGLVDKGGEMVTTAYEPRHLVAWVKKTQLRAMFLYPFLHVCVEGSSYVKRKSREKCFNLSTTVARLRLH